MQSIFNSLGSNYSNKFSFRAFKNIFFSPKKAVVLLEEELSKKFTGKAVVLYKGRDSIEFALRSLLPKGSLILTQAFSCYAVEEGIARSGMNPIYVDIESKSTNVSLKNIKEIFKKHKLIRAVIIQHSLGIPAKIDEIKKWCNKESIILIEDIAQGFGGTLNGIPLGNFGDVIICSFGRDKIIDSVSGGAVIFRNISEDQAQKVFAMRENILLIPFWVSISDLLYPVTTQLIRKTHHIGIGKIFFMLAKAIGLLRSPIKSKLKEISKLNSAYADLALLSLTEINQQLEHRKHIAKIYFAELNHFIDFEMLINVDRIDESSNLRFSFLCKDTELLTKIVNKLKEKRIYIFDRWYRKAVDCGSFACKTAYQESSCQNAEYVARRILNLPTHREISPEIALRICGLIIDVIKKDN